jgi:cell division septation protein DedD
MEEQTTWKGHSLTLLVFAGIVVLCSIFFILGMLVGRQQGQKFATIAAAEAAAKEQLKIAPAEEKTQLTFFDSVERGKQPLALEPAPPETPGVSPEPAKTPDPAPSTTAINYQIGAVRKSSDADKLLRQVKTKGFRAFILGPAPGEANPFFRVQVGPFSNVIEAEDARKKLDAAGYKPILKK